MNGSSGCFGCYQKPTTISKVDMPSNRLAIQGNAVKKSSPSEDFWTRSTLDMDNSAVQSQGSISSTSVTNQALDPHGASSKTTNPPEFVNHGHILWNQTRQRWVGNNRSHGQNQTHQPQEPKLSWDATYESLLGSNKPFSQPIPLPISYINMNRKWWTFLWTYGNKRACIIEPWKLRIAEIIFSS